MLNFLVLPFALAVLPVFFVSYGSLTGIVVACVTFGLVLGMQESIYRAAVCELVPLGRRGTAYGIFNAILGFGTLASGVIFGYFLNKGNSLIVLVVFALMMQVFAILVLGRNRRLFQTLQQNNTEN